MKDRLCKAFWCVMAGLVVFTCASTARAQIQVTSANPNNAAQGTVNLNVIVTGNGFKKGAKAQWFISGTTNPGGVTVNSTSFDSSGQLTANISVSATAYVGGFDVVVTNTDGRGGKGTELFAVKTSSGQTATCPTPVPINPAVNACSSSTAQTSCLDSTFGSAGLVGTSTSSSGGIEQSVRQQADGKLVTIGWSIYPWIGVFAERFNTDGSIDTTFGNQGWIKYLFSSTDLHTNDSAMDAAGNILILGFETGNGFILRFTPSGALDSTFASGGALLFSGYGEPRGIALQPDGKIVVAGIKSGPPAAQGFLLRFNPNGTIDSTFGLQGNVLYSSATFNHVVVQPYGGTNYLLAAATPFGAVRFTLSGSLDTTFGKSGIVMNSLCGYGGQAYDIALDPVTGFYLGGFGPVANGGANKVVVAKYSSIGQLDTTFGDGPNTGEGLVGAAVIDFNGGVNSFAIGQGIATTQNTSGNTLIYINGAASNYFNLARLNANGTLDKTWGGTGAVATTFSGSSQDAWPYGVLVQSNGSIIQAGVNEWINLPSPYPIVIALARFWP